MTKIRAFIVDDSAQNRQMLGTIFSQSGDFEVVGRASNGADALKLVTSLKPDLITLDLEMPRMDGFTFLRLLMANTPLPVIVVSSHSQQQEVFRALEFGAVDFVAKPQLATPLENERFRQEVLAKSLVARVLQKGILQRRLKFDEPLGSLDAPSTFASSELRRIVCIGASTGGPPALDMLVRLLAPESGVAYLVAQHMPAKFTTAFADRLNRISRLTVREARPEMVLQSGDVMIAPGGHHLEIKKLGKRWGAAVSPCELDDHYVPSVDRLFHSAASTFEKNVCAVVLTGMGSDGRQGIRAVRGAGGLTIAESEATAVVYGMPAAAVATGCIDHVVPLPQVADVVRNWTRHMP